MSTATLETPPALGATPGRGLRKFKNNLATVLIIASFCIALIPLVWLLWTVISKGLHAITRNGWFTQSQRGITYRDPGGGAWHAILGTFLQVALCSVISIPIAVLVGIYLVEYGRGSLARATTFMVDILTGVPSIVAALFIYAVFVTTFHGQRAGWLVSLALVMLMVPVIVRTTEEMLKLVPNELREASYALGVPKWKTIARIVLPTAFTGDPHRHRARYCPVAAETAPLILVGYTPDTNGNLFSGFQGSLPTMIYDQVGNLLGKHPRTREHGKAVTIHYAADRMWGAALTLIILVMALNIIARLIGRFSKVNR